MTSNGNHKRLERLEQHIATDTTPDGDGLFPATFDGLLAARRDYWCRWLACDRAALQARHRDHIAALQAQAISCQRSIGSGFHGGVVVDALRFTQEQVQAALDRMADVGHMLDLHHHHAPLLAELEQADAMTLHLYAYSVAGVGWLMCAVHWHTAHYYSFFHPVPFAGAVIYAGLITGGRYGDDALELEEQFLNRATLPHRRWFVHQTGVLCIDR